MRHLLEIDDLTAEELGRILAIATSVETPAFSQERARR
jgi:aspartate carbamoyltransferase catalytic subunit